MRLLPAANGGRYPAIEVLLATPAVKNIIREGKSHLIDNVILTSSSVGMTTLETSLASLVRAGHVTLEVALSYSLRPQELMREVKGK